MNRAIKLPALAKADPWIRAKVADLASQITEATGVSLEAMLGRGRTTDISHARQCLMAALWKEGLSISEVGYVLGRDHTTVIFGLRKLVPADDYRARVTL